MDINYRADIVFDLANWCCELKSESLPLVYLFRWN